MQIYAIKNSSDSYCVYKMNDAVLASFLFAIVGVTVRRQELHRGFSVSLHCSYWILITYCLFIYCNFLVTTGLNYILQNQLGLNSRKTCAAEGKLECCVRVWST